MPTVLREAGFEVRIYTFDHPPPHVHVEKAGAIVKIDLATAVVVRINGSISDRDVKRAEAIVAKHRQTLWNAWRELHGEK
jgi:hypothetical protein